MSGRPRSAQSRLRSMQRPLSGQRNAAFRPGPAAGSLKIIHGSMNSLARRVRAEQRLKTSPHYRPEVDGVGATLSPLRGPVNLRPRSAAPRMRPQSGSKEEEEKQEQKKTEEEKEEEKGHEEQPAGVRTPPHSPAPPPVFRRPTSSPAQRTRPGSAASGRRPGSAKGTGLRVLTNVTEISRSGRRSPTSPSSPSSARSTGSAGSVRSARSRSPAGRTRELAREKEYGAEPPSPGGGIRGSPYQRLRKLRVQSAGPRTSPAVALSPNSPSRRLRSAGYDKPAASERRTREMMPKRKAPKPFQDILEEELADFYGLPSPKEQRAALASSDDEEQLDPEQEVHLDATRKVATELNASLDEMLARLRIPSNAYALGVPVVHKSRYGRAVASLFERQDARDVDWVVAEMLRSASAKVERLAVYYKAQTENKGHIMEQLMEARGQLMDNEAEMSSLRQTAARVRSPSRVRKLTAVEEDLEIAKQLSDVYKELGVDVDDVIDIRTCQILALDIVNMRVAHDKRLSEEYNEKLKLREALLESKSSNKHLTSQVNAVQEHSNALQKKIHTMVGEKRTLLMQLSDVKYWKDRVDVLENKLNLLKSETKDLRERVARSQTLTNSAKAWAHRLERELLKLSESTKSKRRFRSKADNDADRTVTSLLMERPPELSGSSTASVQDLQEKMKTFKQQSPRSLAGWGSPREAGQYDINDDDAELMEEALLHQLDSTLKTWANGTLVSKKEHPSLQITDTCDAVDTSVFSKIMPKPFFEANKAEAPHLEHQPHSLCRKLLGGVSELSEEVAERMLRAQRLHKTDQKVLNMTLLFACKVLSDEYTPQAVGGGEGRSAVDDNHLFIHNKLYFALVDEGKPERFEVVCSVVAGVYQAKIVADAADDRNHIERRSMELFLQDYMLNKYGLKPLARRHLANLLAGVAKYASKSPRLRVFARLVNMKVCCQDANCDHPAETYDPSAADFVLQLLLSIWPDSVKSIAETMGGATCIVSKSAFDAAILNTFKFSRATREVEKLRSFIEQHAQTVPRHRRTNVPQVNLDICVEHLMSLRYIERRCGEEVAAAAVRKELRFFIVGQVAGREEEEMLGNAEMQQELADVRAFLTRGDRELRGELSFSDFEQLVLSEVPRADDDKIKQFFMEAYLMSVELEAQQHGDSKKYYNRVTDPDSVCATKTIDIRTVVDVFAHEAYEQEGAGDSRWTAKPTRHANRGGADALPYLEKIETKRQGRTDGKVDLGAGKRGKKGSVEKSGEDAVVANAVAKFRVAAKQGKMQGRRRRASRAGPPKPMPGDMVALSDIKR